MPQLEMLWLELTSLCNLECVHCYADSGPYHQDVGALTESDYVALIKSANKLGCQRIQFIGGEPTLVPYLPRLLLATRSCSFESVEVYTNATHLTDELVGSFLSNHVDVAVSFYSDVPEVHDAVTRRRGSHAATIAGIKKLVSAGVQTRVSVIRMSQNTDRMLQTKELIEELGVCDVSFDDVRQIGRGRDGLDPKQMPDVTQELCGQCGYRRLAVLPSGFVTPCIMSRKCVIGSVKQESLERLIASPKLFEFRSSIRIADAALFAAEEPRSPQCSPNKNPNTSPQCSPNKTCSPVTAPNTSPQCSPNKTCSPVTVPNTSPQCSPNGTCSPVVKTGRSTATQSA